MYLSLVGEQKALSAFKVSENMEQSACGPRVKGKVSLITWGKVMSRLANQRTDFKSSKMCEVGPQAVGKNSLLCS